MLRRTVFFFSILSLTSCGSFPNKQDQNVQNVVLPRPIVLHDGVYQLRLAPNIPRLAAKIPVDLPRSEEGLRWRLQLMTPKNEQNDVSVVVSDPSGTLPQLLLDQSSDFSEDKTPIKRDTAKLGTGPFHSSMRIEFLAPDQATASQRISLIAQQVPID